MTDTNRLFFALWPDDKIRQALSQAFLSSTYAKAEGRPFNFMNLHLTLHFLGNVSADKYSCVIKAAENVKFNKFNLSLDTFGFFEKANVLWLGAGEVPDELTQLHYKLGRALSDCDFRSEDRAFTPHVTLMRKIKKIEVEECVQEINWSVDKFALIESITINGSVLYKPVKFYNA